MAGPKNPIIIPALPSRNPNEPPAVSLPNGPSCPSPPWHVGWSSNSLPAVAGSPSIRVHPRSSVATCGSLRHSFLDSCFPWLPSWPLPSLIDAARDWPKYILIYSIAFLLPWQPRLRSSVVPYRFNLPLCPKVKTLHFLREIHASPQFRAEWFIAPSQNPLFSRPKCPQNWPHPHFCLTCSVPALIGRSPTAAR